MSTAAHVEAARSVPAGDVDLLAHLPSGGSAWVHRGEGWLGWPTGDVTPDPGIGPGSQRLAAAWEWLEPVLRHPRGAGVAFLSATFDPEAGGSRVTVPPAAARLHGGRLELRGDAEALPPEQPPVPSPGRVTYAGSTLPELEWLAAVDAAVRELEDPQAALVKVVLARDLLVRTPSPLDAAVLARRLAARFPTCFTFVHEGLVGATPELLVRRSTTQVDALVLAGSAPRGGAADEDRRLGGALLASEKDRAEHHHAVASVRTALGPLCAALEVEPEPHLLRLANVQHLATRVSGRLPDPGTTLLHLADALHPTAAVCGSPTPAALQRIRRLEGMDRGRYAGPVGWVDGVGDGELGIALRCAELTPGGARLFAGAGIVAGSRPEGELEETRLKLAAMRSALEDGPLASPSSKERA